MQKMNVEYVDQEEIFLNNRVHKRFMKELSTRFATEEDTQKIYRFLKENFYPGTRFEKMSLRQFSHYFEIIMQFTTVLLAENLDSDLIAHFQVSSRKIRTKRNFIEIGTIGSGCVRSDKRRQGIANYLLDISEEIFKSRDLPYSAFFSDPNNPSYNHGLKRGYEIVAKLYGLRMRITKHIVKLASNSLKLHMWEAVHYQSGLEDEIVNLFNQSFKRYVGFVERTEDFWRNWYKNPQFSFSPEIFLAVKQKNHLVGFMQTRKTRDELQIIDFAVRESLKTGVIHFLLSLAVIEADRLNCKYLTIYPPKSFLGAEILIEFGLRPFFGNTLLCKSLKAEKSSFAISLGGDSCFIPRGDVW